jgi:large subunit ribosomal protein L25
METQNTHVLSATKREGTGKGVARKLRAVGQIPAVVYGGGGAATSLQLSPDSVTKLFENPKGKNVLFDLDLGVEQIKNVMVKDYLIHPAKRSLLHVDFFTVDLEKPVKAQVPIEPIGRSKGVAEGGVLTIIRQTVEVFAKPAEIPEKVEIDVTELVAGQTVTAKDITLPEGVKPAWRAPYGLLRVVMPRRKG